MCIWVQSPRRPAKGPEEVVLGKEVLGKQGGQQLQAAALVSALSGMKVSPWSPGERGVQGRVLGTFFPPCGCYEKLCILTVTLSLFHPLWHTGRWLSFSPSTGLGSFSFILCPSYTINTWLIRYPSLPYTGGSVQRNEWA